MSDTLFDKLWSNHPANEDPPLIEPCSTHGRSNHGNQCVIRLGLSFVRSSISLASYRGVFCWSRHGRQHPLRVEQMKLWLDSDDVTFVDYADISRKDRRGHQASYQSYLGRRGIVACINFWGSGNQGDHIDLWDGSVMAHGGRDYFQRSQEIWFWEM